MVCFSSLEQSSEVLQTMFVTKKHADIVLVAGKSNQKRISAHKSVLTASLEYFDCMFSGSFKETERSEIVMNEMDPDILEAVIKFLYVGLIEIPNVETAILLWEAAHLMEITLLQKHVLTFIYRSITPENSLGLYALAKKFDEEELRTKAFNLAVRELPLVIKGDEFKNLDVEGVIEYINASKDTALENDLAKAILTWINFDRKREKVHIKELLPILRIELIDRMDLIEQLQWKLKDLDDFKFAFQAVADFNIAKCDDDPKALMKNPDILGLSQTLNNGNSVIYQYNVFNNDVLDKLVLKVNGDIAGVWNGRLIVRSIKDDIHKINLQDLNGKVLREMGSFTDVVCIKLFKDNLYILSSDSFTKYNFITGRKRTVKVVGNTIESGAFLNGQTYFITYDEKKSQHIKIAIYCKRSQSLQYFDCEDIITSSEDYGHLVGHESRIYYLNGKELFIFHPSSKKWTKENELEVEVGEESSLISIQGNLFLATNGQIYKYMNTKSFQPVDSPLGRMKVNPDLKIFSFGN